MAKQTYYAVLGVQNTDDEATIKKAFHKLAKENHPDLHPGDTAAEARFKEVNEAWEVLGDEEKRKKYDDELAGVNKNPFAPGAASPKATPQGRPMTQDDYQNMMRGFDNFFSPDSIKKSADGMNKGANPIDTTSMFDRYMGFTGPKKKK